MDARGCTNALPAFRSERIHNLRGCANEGMARHAPTSWTGSWGLCYQNVFTLLDFAYLPGVDILVLEGGAHFCYAVGGDGCEEAA